MRLRLATVLSLVLVALTSLSLQQSMVRTFRRLAGRRAGQAYDLFRKIRDPVKYKLQFAPTNLKRLLHGYYPKKPKGRVSNKIYHVHHHHYPKKKPLFVIPKPLFKLPKLPSFPKPKLPKLSFPKINLPKIKVSIEDAVDPSTGYGVPSSDYGIPSSDYGAPSVDYGVPSSPPDNIRYEPPPIEYASPTINSEYDEYGAPVASILGDEDIALESYNSADKLSTFDFDPLGSEVFNINDVTKYFPSSDHSVEIIDISSYPETPDTIDIEIVEDDLGNDDISFPAASFGNSYTSYSNPSASYSYGSSPVASVGEYSYIPEQGDLEDSLASSSTLDPVITVPLGLPQPQRQDFPQSPYQEEPSNTNNFFDNLKEHTASFSDFDIGKTWETFTNWGGKI